MGIAFRPARVEDAPGLVGLVEELGYPSTPEEVGRRLGLIVAAPDHRVFVAEEDGEVLGWVHVQEFLSVAADPAGLITGLVVATGERKRGIGRALMALAEEWGRERGLATMRLRARTVRKGAHAFYRSMGYVVAKRQLQFRKEL